MLVLLVDISAKQEYVFGSTKLKDNIGASNVLAYKVFEKEILSRCGIIVDKNIISDPPGESGQVVYIGGGNAMFTFEKESEMTSFICKYSKDILISFGGIKLNFGWTQITDKGLDQQWQSTNQKIQLSLTKNKHQQHTLYRPIKTGFVSDCKLSGEAQEVSMDQGKSYVSKELQVKRSNHKFVNEYEDWDVGKIKINLPDGYELSEDIDEIVTDQDNAYLAVVHIDGNGLGKDFISKANKSDFQEFSRQIKRKLAVSLESLIVKVAAKFSDGVFGERTEFEVSLSKKNENYILPIRPIINAGDDITIVCHGKLGLWIAEEYMAILNSSEVGDISISCSAGVAIVNKKFPFAKAYDLAENLAAEAKVKNRQKKIEGKNWINFIISPEGYSGDFEDLLLRHYMDYSGVSVSKGPYLIGEPNEKIEPDFNMLKKKLHSMVYSDAKWPKNKIMDIRDVLSKSIIEQKLFELHMEARGLELTDIQSFPYFDMVDMIDFYPHQLLNLKND